MLNLYSKSLIKTISLNYSKLICKSNFSKKINSKLDDVILPDSVVDSSISSSEPIIVTKQGISKKFKILNQNERKEILDDFIDNLQETNKEHMRYFVKKYEPQISECQSFHSFKKIFS